MALPNRHAALIVLGLTACEGLGFDAPTTDDHDSSPSTFHLRVEIANIGPRYTFVDSGVFERPDAASSPGALGPGESFTFTFHSRPGDSLSLASMVVESNDHFVAPSAAGGIPLFNDGVALSGEVSGAFAVWDAGTEIDEPWGDGAHQPAADPPGADEAPLDPQGVVRRVEADLLAVPLPEFLSVDVLTEAATASTYQTTVVITNVSTPGTLETSSGAADLHLAAGVWVLHTGESPLFEEGQADRGLGLEALAEDGSPAILGAQLAADSGIELGFSAGVWGLSHDALPLVELGAALPDLGLESLAEDGDFQPLLGMLATLPQLTQFGATAVSSEDYTMGSIAPGQQYSFEIEATPGSRLHLFNMFAPSNDWFVASATGGLALFGDDGAVALGDLSSQLALLDAGTEADDPLGYGLDQVHLQAQPNTGAPDPDATVRLAGSGIDLGDYLSVEIQLVDETQ